MISNRPDYLEKNIKFYKAFPVGYNMDADYHRLPPLLNFDFHTLNGVLPLTKSRFDYLGRNGAVDGVESSVILVNPLEEEYQYYESLGITEFQAVSIILSFCAFEESEGRALKGIPYSVSLVPMEKNGQIDTWNINLLRAHDLEKICQEGGWVQTEFNPFLGWYDGMFMHYSLFSKMGLKTYIDSIGFQWGMYFLAPVFDKKEVIMPENHTYSKTINAKYRKYKTDLYFKPFTNTKPRRIWGCDSPIELFLLQGLFIRKRSPEIQMCIYKTGEIYPNYYKMQESEYWIGEDRLITAADFYFQDKKLAIFCDGKEFHDPEKDRKINSSLDDLGIKVLRFSGKRITEELESVLDEIEACLD